MHPFFLITFTDHLTEGELGMHFLERILDLIFVPSCVSCGIRLDHGVLCDTCRETYEKRKQRTCSICGHRLSECQCVPSLVRRAGASDHVKLFFYDPLEPGMPENRMIYKMKRKNHKPLARFLAAELCEALRNRLPNRNTLVTYMPRGKKAVIEHGVDQSAVLAKELAKSLSLDFASLFVRRGDGVQKTLGKEARLLHAAEAYRIKKGTDLTGAHILLLDDVVTSGATLAVGTKLLLHAGAKSVSIVTLASVINASHSSM